MAEPARIRTTPRDNLPTQITSLVGRERDIVEVCRLLLREDIHLLTLTGPPGIGKTRLAIHAAGNLRSQQPGGCYFVNLAPVNDPKLVLPTIATVLGLHQPGNQPLTDLVATFLAGKHLLLLLDNFEQVIPAGLDVAHLLSVAPGFKVLVTSRELLHLSAEHAFMVPPLSLPPEESMGSTGNLRDHEKPGSPSLEHLTRYEAVRLFVQRASALKSDFKLDSGNARAVAEICRRLDGLPLAIELAAARIRHLPPEALLQRLRRRLYLLTDGPYDLPDRQRTLRATIEWSYNLLDSPERRLFRRLAVFRGGRTLEAIEAVCNADLDLGTEALTGVSSLMDKSLLYRVPGVGGGGAPRYVYLETIHELALEKLEASGEETALRKQHATYFAELAQRAEAPLKGPDQAEWLDRLDAEQDNFRAALDWAYDNDIVLGLRLIAGLGTFWNRRGYLSEGRDRAAAILARARGQGANATSTMARALYTLGLIAFYQGDFIMSRSVLQESKDIYGELEQPTAGSGLAGSLNVLGIVESRLENIPSRRKLHEEALAISEEIGDAWSAGRSLYQLGHTARISGNYDEASARFTESLAIFQKCGDHFNIGLSLLGLGHIAKRKGDYQSAQDLLNGSLVIFKDLRDTWGISSTLYSLACVAQEMKDYARAQSIHEENLEYIKELGAKSDLAETLERLGRIAYFQGDYARAHELQKRGLIQFTDLQDKIGTALCLLSVGGVAVVASVTASVGTAAGPHRQRTAAQARREATVARAVQVMGAANALFTGLRFHLDPEGQALFTTYIDTARNTLGEEAFAEAWVSGQAISPEEAVGLALAIGLPGKPRSPSQARTSSRGRKQNLGELTRRERQVVVLVAQGKSNREIAEELVITVRTVEGHVSAILARLNFRSRSQISAWAVENGLTAQAS